ncbi:hypothetical protein MMYC01_206902 [Madurella mycetomatis]|uniref:Uncharacterized protein n=1 Tax=Madurella mycetomatis TaxID=100816 RepID=A0A175W1F2_9PEZI|nr:hypothetical protein MMYC01_206902 [Madurella mycetomatis]
MAPATITKPVASSPRTSTYANGSENDRVANLTPTRSVSTPISPAAVDRTDVPRHKIAVSQVAAVKRSAMPSLLVGRAPDAPSLGHTIGRSYSRDNTVDSVTLSKSNSVPWSDEGSDNSSEGDSLPSAAPLRRRSPPPPQLLPLPSTVKFRPPALWPVNLGHGGRRPPAQLSQGIPSTASESEYSDSYSDGGTRSLSHGSGHSVLEELIETRRQSIWLLRHDMARKREELRELRRRKDDIDNAFMQTFRPHLASKAHIVVVPTDLLGERFREMQSVRDEYYTAESAYEAMELGLDKEEKVLEKLEANMARVPRGQVNARTRRSCLINPPTMEAGERVEAKPKGAPCEQDGSRPRSPVSLLGISGELQEDIHPLYQELLEAAGDRQLAEEYCEDIEIHREKILYDLELELHRKRVRNNQGNLISEEDLRSLRSSLTRVPADAAEFKARFGITISEDDLEFLRDYEFVEKQAKKELEEASQTLNRLRELCIEKGVMRKHASYHEELAIFSGSNRMPTPADGNIAIESGPRPAAGGLAHPRFPILLSNPSHVLDLLSPIAALERALKLPKDDPMSAQRRAECMKELGISTLMKKTESTPDYINQWLIHRLRTSPMEAELMLAVCESVFKVVNLRRWQEEVLYYWRLDDAAKLSPLAFQGAQTPRDNNDELGLGFEFGLEDGEASRSQLNSVIEESARVKSDDAAEAAAAGANPLRKMAVARSRSVRSIR